MKLPPKIGLKGVESFIKNDLLEKLRADLVAHRMVKEADAESCAYYDLPSENYTIG
jgi:hypothetical protein